MHAAATAAAVNPFCGAAARRYSAYCASHKGELVPLLGTARPSSDAQFAHLTLRAAILHPDFPCVGAKAAVHQGTLRTAHYPALADRAVTHGLARDLFAFVSELQTGDDEFSSFVATFAQHSELSEAAFERTLWRQLQLLRDLDARFHDWNSGVDADPESARFAYSFGGEAFFVVGLHRNSARWARRLPFAALAFNPRRQFDRLRARGDFGRMQAVIRAADRRLQGSTNPMVEATHLSEARQYSGRVVGADWRCPFTAHRT